MISYIELKNTHVVVVCLVAIFQQLATRTAEEEAGFSKAKNTGWGFDQLIFLYHPSFLAATCSLFYGYEDYGHS